MKAHEALIAYTPADCDGDPAAGRVEIGRLVASEGPDWTDPYLMTVGAAYYVRRNWRGYRSIAARVVAAVPQ